MTRIEKTLIVGVTVALMASGWAIAGGISIKDDLFLGVWSPFASKWEKRVPVCVWSEDSETIYRVIGSGSSTGGNFAMTNELGETVAYSVFWHSGNRFRRREKLIPSTPSRRSYPFDSDQNCPDGPSAEIRVKLNKRQIDRAMPAIYQDTLLFILSPI